MSILPTDVREAAGGYPLAEERRQTELGMLSASHTPVLPQDGGNRVLLEASEIFSVKGQIVDILSWGQSLSELLISVVTAQSNHRLYVSEWMNVHVFQ